MVGSVMSSSARGSHSVDRFYNPHQRRQMRLQQQQQQQQQQQKQEQVQEQRQQRQRVVRTKFPRVPTPPATHVECREVDCRMESDDSSSKPSVSSSPCPSPPPKLTPVGNFDRFLQFTTPSVRAQYLSKKIITGRRRVNASELYSYFSLGDLWESFREWSAYGAGVPLLLSGSDDVMQYYVPYLSGIQLYVDSSISGTRCLSEGNNGELHIDAGNEGKNGGSDERQFDSVPVVDGCWRISDKLNGISLVDKARNSLEGSSSDDGEIQSTPHLIFEYFESSLPHLREPLTEKVSALARRFPELKTYRSCDLLPSSWISIAWYPIYRIPVGSTLQDLDASFLTFHLLATPSKRVHPSIQNGAPELSSCSGKKRSGTVGVMPSLSLPIFGLASYKFRSSVWIPDGISDQNPASLLQAADEWLRHLQVQHPDYIFFTDKQRNGFQK